LTSGREPRGRLEPLACVLGLDDLALEPGHRAFDLGGGLVRREPGQPGIGRQFDIDRDAIGIKPGLCEQFGIGLGNRLEVDIAAKIMLLAQDPRDLHQLLHGVVRRFHDPRGEEQPLDVIAAIET